MSTKDYSTKQEKQIANYLDWKTVSASGARDFNKGDIISDEWLGECKTHTTSEHDVIFKKSVWDKLCSETLVTRRNPVLFVDDGSQSLDKTWCLFRQSDILNDCITINFPIKCRTNIKFNHYDLLRLCNQVQAFSIDIFGEPLMVCRLEDFKSIITK